MRNFWCSEKNSILPFIIPATGIVPQSLFKNLKILDLENTLVGKIAVPPGGGGIRINKNFPILVLFEKLNGKENISVIPNFWSSLLHILFPP
jgi:hypothetical protein